MRVHIERIKRLFPKDVCKKMLEIPTDYGQCAYNSAKAMMDFMNYNIVYCEGWLDGDIGHAFNKLVDDNGNVHYFDISQEYIKARDHNKGGLRDIELENEVEFDDVLKTFNEDKVAHLITVPTFRGNQTYAQLKERGLEELFFD